jgi:hypothetical protein
MLPGMKVVMHMRILWALVVAVLVLGPAMAFAAPMPAGMQDMSGKTAISVPTTVPAKTCCMDCPTSGKGNAMTAYSCDAMCPLPVVLPAQPTSPDRLITLAWLILPTPGHSTIAARLDPPPPKSSSRI